MKASENVKTMIKGFEGLVLKAMRCPAGVWTIGYGHTSGVRPGDMITREAANAQFEADIELFERRLQPLLAGVSLNQNQYDALVSFSFNVGSGALGRSTLLRLVKANPSDPAIRGEFMKWVKGGGKTLPGLVKRRQREADLYFTPCNAA